MAIVRCAEHGVGKPGTGHWTHEYVRYVMPNGGGVVCGNLSCEHAGLIWLEKHESDAYDKGTRVFGLLRNRAKVRAR